MDISSYMSLWDHLNSFIVERYSRHEIADNTIIQLNAIIQEAEIEYIIEHEYGGSNMYIFEYFEKKYK